MTSQASRTAIDGCEQRRAPITRPLYHTSHGSTHRHHLSHPLTPTIPPYYDGLLPHESYQDERTVERIVVERASPSVDQISALCEEIAATMNEDEALRLVMVRIAELMDGASAQALVDHDLIPQNNAQAAENLSVSKNMQTAGVIHIPLMSGGTRLGVLRVAPHLTEALPAHASNMLRLIGAALAQALERHRLRATLNRCATDATPSHEGHQRWEEFLGRVAHEVKTPLTCINGHAQLVRRYVRLARDAATGELTPQSAMRVVDACERHLPPLERQVAHIERLMRSMLDLAQIEQGPLTLALERCDFVTLLQRAAHAVDVFEDCQLDLAVPDSLMLTCDARRIEQALYNILHYAIRVGGYGGTLRVRVAARQLNGVRQVLAVIGDRPQPPQTRDCAILSRRDLRALRDHVVAGMDQMPTPIALGVALSATISRLHSGNLYHLPGAPTGGAFVLALPISGPHTT